MSRVALWLQHLYTRRVAALASTTPSVCCALSPLLLDSDSEEEGRDPDEAKAAQMLVHKKSAPWYAFTFECVPAYP